MSKQSGCLSFLMAEEYSIVYINHSFFIHSSVDGHLSSFHRLPIIDIAAVNIGVQVPLWITTSVSFFKNYFMIVREREREREAET